MSKITLDSVASGYDLSKINNNFQTIEDELNDKVLYRNNPVGEVNTLITAIDCNDKSLYNLPEPTLSHQVATKNYVDTAPTTNAAAAAASAAAAAVSETNAAASAANAAAAVVTVSDQKIVWQGTWSGATAYVVNDAVSASGSSYICILANTNQTPPNATYWEVLAQQGAAGAGTGDMLAANNLSDVADTATARTNLGVQIGSNVQAYDANLQTLAALTLAQGDILTASGADTVTQLAKGTASQQLRMNAGATAPEWFTPVAAGITLGTQQASTSGTSIDFTSIPAGVKRITVMFDGVSTNSATTQMIIRIGDSGGIETSGYVSAASSAGRTDGFSVSDYGAAANIHTGKIVLDLMNAATFKWVASGSMAITDVPISQSMGGVKSLSAELDRLSITTTAGTATFDSGSINISYE